MENQVKERPILFSGPMVKALLAGTKTQTRRIVKLPNGRVSKKPQPMPDYIGSWVNSANSDLWAGFGTGEARPDGVQNTVNTMRTGWFACPYGKVGDRLWVRETHAFFSSHITLARSRYVYRADASPQCESAVAKYDKWRTPIYMPREAARLLLEIVAVRVERLQQISRMDAVQEGIQRHEGLSYKLYGKHRHQNCLKDGLAIAGTAQQSYETLWNSINGPDSWEANPWVWVVEFKVISPASYTIEKTTPEPSI
jgi:hypothetical protein